VVSNLYVRQANLKVILELTGSHVVQREEQWPVVVKGWVRLREQLRFATRCNFCRAMRCIRAAYVVMRCVSVCVSVCLSRS